MFLVPKLGYALNIEFNNRNAMEFIYNIIRTELAKRRKDKVKKHDFLDSLAEVLNEAEANGGVIEGKMYYYLPGT